MLVKKKKKNKTQHETRIIQHVSNCANNKKGF